MPSACNISNPPKHLPGPQSAWADWAAVITAMIFPSLATWLYFVALDGSESMKVAYSGTKIVQFAFPVLWVFWIRRGRPRLEPTGGGGATPAVFFGLFVGAAMVAAYLLLIRRTDWLDAGTEQVRAKVLGMGIDTPAKFAALALFYALVHSLLEEYFWRWYVFNELRRFLRDWTAIVLSSLAFMAHHVIVLGLYFRENWWLTLPLSLSVAIGGAVWAELYRRNGKLTGPWLSHAIVDAAIMAIGYQMIWGFGAL